MGEIKFEPTSVFVDKILKELFTKKELDSLPDEIKEYLSDKGKKQFAVIKALSGLALKRARDVKGFNDYLEEVTPMKNPPGVESASSLYAQALIYYLKHVIDFWDDYEKETLKKAILDEIERQVGAEQATKRNAESVRRAIKKHKRNIEELNRRHMEATPRYWYSSSDRDREFLEGVVVRNNLFSRILKDL